MNQPAVNFDPVARLYRWLEYFSFGPWLARCRGTHLAQLSAAHHALVLGDGDGRFLAKLLAASPAMTADVVDSSECMLRLLMDRVRRLRPSAGKRVCLHHTDALIWSPARPYDLIVTHFFLDCFFPHQLELLCDLYLPHALPGTRWVISEFAVPRNAGAAVLARTIIRLLYRAFGWLTGLPVRALPEWSGLLLRRGFVLTAERTYLAGLLCSQVWRLPLSASVDHAQSVPQMN